MLGQITGELPSVPMSPRPQRTDMFSQIEALHIRLIESHGLGPGRAFDGAGIVPTTKRSKSNIPGSVTTTTATNA